MHHEPRWPRVATPQSHGGLGMHLNLTRRELRPGCRIAEDKCRLQKFPPMPSFAPLRRLQLSIRKLIPPSLGLLYSGQQSRPQGHHILPSRSSRENTRCHRLIFTPFPSQRPPREQPRQLRHRRQLHAARFSRLTRPATPIPPLLSQARPSLRLLLPFLPASALKSSSQSAATFTSPTPCSLVPFQLHVLSRCCQTECGLLTTLSSSQTPR
ncbi:hypothetical protein FB451DRAFT_106236 [Mycena latifolia]|nr:hypothetical protein FB451DRAFT_106236 [Mycena latifolia]